MFTEMRSIHDQDMIPATGIEIKSLSELRKGPA